MTRLHQTHSVQNFHNQHQKATHCMDCTTKPSVYSCFLSPNSLTLVTGYLSH